jgi:hypothetical protein
MIRLIFGFQLPLAGYICFITSPLLCIWNITYNPNINILYGIYLIPIIPNLTQYKTYNTCQTSYNPILLYGISPGSSPIHIFISLYTYTDTY